MVVYKLREMLSRSLLRAAPNRAVKSIPQRSTGIVAGARARSLHSTGSRRNAETVQTPTSEEKGFEAHFGPRASITHKISSLGPSLLFKSTTLGGWLTGRRQANPTLAFFNLSDSTGQVQLVVNAKDHPSGDVEQGKRLVEELMRVPLHSVVQVEGTVKSKLAAKKADQQDTVEVSVTKYTMLNPADKVLPFYPNSRDSPANETLRNQYRYLDLRSDKLGENIRKRSRVTKMIRDYLHDLEFTEVETPVLLQSSPEGAREYLVPTRLTSPISPADNSASTSADAPSPTSQEPLFYALQQSPQQPKQLLVASGLTSKYFQIARCFRDESGRKDRQAEFTQVDLEMSFVSGAPQVGDGAEGGMRSTWRIGGAEVREVIEGLVKKIWKEVEGVDLPGWFQVMPYEVAMDVYGSDKPDTRFKMYTLPIAYYPALSDADIDKLLADDKPDTVEFMITPKQDVGSLQVDKLAEEMQDVERIEITSANRTTWTSDSELLRPLGLQPESSRPGGAEVGDIVWLAKRRKQPDSGWTKLGRLRVKLRDQLVEAGALQLPSDPHFLWITEFPLFTRSDEDKEFQAKGRWSSSHHPFTAPMYEDMENLKTGKIEQVRGQHYDLVLNGMEVGGGSVRIHDAKLQEYVLTKVLELDESEVARFGHLLQALRFGAPPHAGIALGLDRLVAILCGTSSIRDVIAFPKTAGGADPVFKSPSPGPADDVLGQYGLKRA